MSGHHHGPQPRSAPSVGRSVRSHASRSGPGSVTALLQTWGEGDAKAFEALLPIVYNSLRNAASGYLRDERPDHTLQPTALVHETFLRLVSLHRVRLRDRRHFFALAAMIMRRILVDYARRRAYDKRGGARDDLSLSSLRDVPTYLPCEVLTVDQALRRLMRVDPDKVRLVHLRYFAGLSIDEAADVLGCSRATVIRRWRLTKAWLARELSTDS